MADDLHEQERALWGDPPEDGDYGEISSARLAALERVSEELLRTEYQIHEVPARTVVQIPADDWNKLRHLALAALDAVDKS